MASDMNDEVSETPAVIAKKKRSYDVSFKLKVVDFAEKIAIEGLPGNLTWMTREYESGESKRLAWLCYQTRKEDWMVEEGKQYALKWNRN